MFDQGLWTINDDLTLRIARNHFTEDHPSGKTLAEFDGQPLLPPADLAMRPDPVYLAWHRKKKFLDNDKT